jgi:hypothetical protein
VAEQGLKRNWMNKQTLGVAARADDSSRSGERKRRMVNYEGGKPREDRAVWLTDRQTCWEQYNKRGREDNKGGGRTKRRAKEMKRMKREREREMKKRRSELRKASRKLLAGE